MYEHVQMQSAPSSLLDLPANLARLRVTGSLARRNSPDAAGRPQQAFLLPRRQSPRSKWASVGVMLTQNR